MALGGWPWGIALVEAWPIKTLSPGGAYNGRVHPG